jgi:hypothetical protein
VWTLNVILLFFLISAALASTVPFQKAPGKSPHQA